MPVPASINDLSPTAGNNSPAGSEAPSTTDDYLRTLSAFIASLRDGASTAGESLTALNGLAVKKDASTTTGAANLPSGTTAQRPSAPTPGMVRHNSTSGEYERYRDGKWLAHHEFDKAIAEAPIVTLASAATVDIGAAAGNTISISGSAAITSLGTAATGIVRRLIFQGALTLTHNATSLILPGGASITTAAGDSAELVSLGSGNWRCLRYTLASGRALVEARAQFGSSGEVVLSGTATDITTLPDDVMQIDIGVYRLSLSGSANPILTLGTAGGLVTTGYSGGGSSSGGSSAATANVLLVRASAAADLYSGTIRLTRLSTTRWAVSSTISDQGGSMRHSGSSVDLGAALTQLRVTSEGGTNTFDSGSISITYQRAS